MSLETARGTPAYVSTGSGLASPALNHQFRDTQKGIGFGNLIPFQARAFRSNISAQKPYIVM